ncbi:hypothetical protein [Aequorivita soesokkakensis]|uniref:hypothetical protein n=1 Tax=Aequorivita soesokkakensis TaxID=1385699 RepID=UPI0013F4E3CF|nr:hypothetical protein [Aequorivita soesokkakensis]
MASREIRWTIRATQDKLAIYEYWTNRNKSILYAQKLEKLFNEVIKLQQFILLQELKPK